MADTLGTRARVARLLQRTGFDAHPDAVAAAEKDGFEATLDRVLAGGSDHGADATPAPDIEPLPPRNSKQQKQQERREGKRAPDGDQRRSETTARGKTEPEPDMSAAAHGDRPTTSHDDPVRKHYRAVLKHQREEVTHWWLDRMVAAERPWAEKRTLLWHNHWATSIQKVKSADAMLRQNETLRRLGGGDFRTLARAMVVDPALMVWLDADGSTAEAPNENLGRELMELFVLGVGNYTENDVRQAAAALTGWTVNRRQQPWTAVFKPRRHHQARRNVVGESADFTARTLVDHLVSLPDSHAHVAGRMWKSLVSNENAPSRSALQRVTAAYGKGRDTTAMFRSLFTDDAFADPDNVLVKQPVEYVVGSLRALGVRPARLPEKARRLLLTRTLAGLGQVPFAPQSVGGWPAGAAWLTTASAQVRIAFAQALVQHADLSDIDDAAAPDRPELLARKLGVGEWGRTTRDSLRDVARDPRRITAVALIAPETLVLS
ncbi:DUF1800 family protein [Streptomyces sp. NPDC047123]|uniref:DUF1800 domain-containing protein n=1 Tax=Streptomyces sp. NPDC047123 TaxID=3155622 RepID=UPI0033C4A8B4